MDAKCFTSQWHPLPRPLRGFITIVKRNYLQFYQHEVTALALQKRGFLPAWRALPRGRSCERCSSVTGSATSSRNG